jgi:hypothetical protein
MPAPLKYFPNDPNKLGRGKGVYYRRGSTYKGKRYAGGYFSKYTRSIDKAKLSRGWKTHKVGLPRGSRIPHTSDGRLPR